MHPEAAANHHSCKLLRLPTQNIQSSLISILHYHSLTMHFSTILLVLATGVSAFRVQDCDGTNKETWNNNVCYDYDVGTDLQYQSNKGCQISFFPEPGCRGVGYSSGSQNKCLALASRRPIKSVRCDDR